MSYVTERSLPSAPARRLRLITPHGLAIVSLTVAASLALLFPGLDFGHPRFLAHPDELSIAYLDQVLRQRPEDRSARLLLARQELALGKWSEADAHLRRLVEGKEDAITRRARLVLVELERAQVDALPVADPARAPRKASALRQVRRVATAPLEGADLSRIAEVALALESPADAAAIYERLASEQPTRRREWALLAGRWYRAAGRLPESAAAYLAASAAAGPSDDGPGDTVAALDVLRAADRGADALPVAGRALERWPADRRLLDRGVTVALAQGDVERAQSWGARLVALVPGNEPILSRQLDLDLAAGDNEAALRTLAALVERRPRDEALRRRMAEVATWAGRPRAALDAWRWLAARGSLQADENALDLAQALFDHKSVIALLEARAKRRELKLPDLLALVDALESDGNPDGARATLRRFEALFANEPEYWRERAALDEHAGDLEAALFSVRVVSRRFSGSVELGVEPEMLWSLDRPDEALAAARAQAQTASPTSVPFWKLFGDLAWSMDADEDAENAYQHVWSAGGGSAEVAERLASLLAARQRIDELARLSADAFQKLGATSVLLTGMEAAVEAERWPAARELASIAAPRRAELEDEPGYWSVLGQLALHDGKPKQAVLALSKAAELAPTDGNLAEDLHSARVEAGLEAAPVEPEDVLDRAAEAASAHLAAAIDRQDRGAVREILATEGGLLTVSERVDAEHEIGRDDRAWDLMARAPALSGDPDEDASLALLRHELAEDRMSGAFAAGRFEDLSGLAMFDQEGRVEVKHGQLSFGAVAEHDRLDSSAGPVIGTVHADEAKAGLGLGFRGPIGDTRLEAGGYGFSSRYVPYATGELRTEPLRGFSVELEAFYHQRPTDTAALRAAALRDSAELELGWRFGERYLVAAAAGATHYGDRAGAFLSDGEIGRLELSALVRKAAPLIRVRADGFFEQNQLATAMPAGLAAVVQPGTSIDNVLPETYGTAGVGVTLLGATDNEDDMASGRTPLACHRCLRPFADVWAGWLMPAQKLTYSLDGGIGYLFARHQELAAMAFYHNDQGGQAGQRYAGASLHYTLRWL
jgi:tetratricopeptide (TPR) repeat protein